MCAQIRFSGFLILLLPSFYSKFTPWRLSSCFLFINYSKSAGTLIRWSTRSMNQSNSFADLSRFCVCVTNLIFIDKNLHICIEFCLNYHWNITKSPSIKRIFILDFRSGGFWLHQIDWNIQQHGLEWRQALNGLNSKRTCNDCIMWWHCFHGMYKHNILVHKYVKQTKPKLFRRHKYKLSKSFNFQMAQTTLWEWFRCSVPAITFCDWNSLNSFCAEMI